MYIISFLYLFAASVLVVSSNILQPCPICPQNSPHQPNNYHRYQPVNTAQSCPLPCCQNNDMNRSFVNKLLSNPTVQMILNPNTRLIDQDGSEVPRQPQNGNQPSVINNYIIIPPEVFTNVTKENKKYSRNNRRRNKKNESQTDTIVAKDNSTYIEVKKDNINANNAIKSLSESLLSLTNYTKLDDDKIKNNKTRERRLRNKKRLNDQGYNNTRSVIEKDIDNKTVVSEDINLNNSLIQNYTSDFKNNKRQSNYKHYEQALKAYTTSKPQSNFVPSETQNESKIDGFNLDHETTRYDDVAIQSTQDNNSNKTEDNILNVVNRDAKEEAIVRDLHKKYPEIPEDLIHNMLLHIEEQLKNEKTTSVSPNKTEVSTSKPKRKRNRNNIRRRKNGDRSRKRKINNRNGTINETTNETETITSKTKNNHSGPIIYKPSTEYPSMMENAPKNLRNFLRKLFNTSEVHTKTVTENLPVNDTDKLDIIGEPSLLTPENLIDDTIKEISSEKPQVEKINNFVDTSDEVLNFIETSTFVPVKPKHDDIDDFGAKNTFPDLGDEDAVPMMELNGIIDEYYPDFTKDAIAYLESNEELNTNHKITDFASRHHYTTDKNYELNEYYSKVNLNEDHNAITNKHVQISKSNDYEDTGPRPYNKHEMESEELDFKSPPLLDAPDFETKAVNMNSYRRDDDGDKYYNKVSSYSDVKAQMNEEEKPNAKIIDADTRDIETHYAKSKVVKYGQNAKFTHDDLDELFDGSEDTALVFASPYED